MAGRNFSGAFYGASDDSTATGLFIGSLDYDSSVSKVDLKNHIDQTVGFTLTDDKVDITCSGSVVSKTAGVVPSIADVISLANTTTDSRSLVSDGIFTTPVAGAGIVVLGGKLTRTNSEFETGDITAIFHPSVSVSSPVSLT